jgi:hypothetical protein
MAIGERERERERAREREISSHQLLKFVLLKPLSSLLVI